MSTTPQNHTELNQSQLHLWSTFGDPSLNRWSVVVQTNSSFTHPDAGGNNNTQSPKLALGKDISVAYFTKEIIQSLFKLGLKSLLK